MAHAIEVFLDGEEQRLAALLALALDDASFRDLDDFHWTSLLGLFNDLLDSILEVLDLILGILLNEFDLLLDFFSELHCQICFDLEVSPQVRDGSLLSFGLLLDVLFTTDTVLCKGILLSVGAGELGLEVSHLCEVVLLLVR